MKYAHIETERRFLIAATPDGVTGVSDVRDRYLSGTRLRLRSVTSDGSTVLKLGQKIRLGNGPDRIAHTTMYLDRAEWAMLAALPGRNLHHVRHHIERDGISLSVREYDDGTLVAEFDGGDSRPADPPAWLEVLREVTDDESFTGSGLAERP